MSKLKRLYANIFVFGSFFFVPFLPWYVPFVMAAIFAWYVSFYEFIILGFLIDVSYDSGHFFTILSHPFPFPFTMLATVVVIVMQIIKKRIRLYE